ncbi:hypothetical protein EJB05_25279, partial [Eragrostis curvula]
MLCRSDRVHKDPARCFHVIPPQRRAPPALRAYKYTDSHSDQLFPGELASLHRQFATLPLSPALPPLTLSGLWGPGVFGRSSSSSAAQQQEELREAPEMTTLTHLPADALGEILRQLDCEADRVRFRSVRLAVKQALAALAEPVRPQLPWLLCFADGAPTIYCIQCGDGENSAIHAVRLQDDVSNSRWFGSYEGRCIFLQTSNGNVLLNLRMNKLYKVPDVAVAHEDKDKRYSMRMLAATLSCTSEEECFGAAIVSREPLSEFMPRRQVVFWAKGGQVAVDPELQRNIEDVIYHKKAFYVCVPKLLLDGSLDLDWRVFYIKPEEHLAHEEKKDNRQVPGRVKRMFFLAKASSRAYELIDFPRFTEGIYFVDDDASFNMQDPELADPNSGKWSGDQAGIRSCFPFLQAVASRSETPEQKGRSRENANATNAKSTCTLPRCAKTSCIDILCSVT